MNETMSVEKVTPEAFSDLKQEWDELLARSASRSVFLTWTWMHTWWTVFRPRAQLYILTARHNERLVGIAPLYIQDARWFQPKRLRLCSASDVSPDYLDLIAETGAEDLVCRAVLTYLQQHRRDWDVAELDDLAPDSPLLRLAPDYWKSLAQIERAHQCPYVQFGGKRFKDYFASTKLAQFSLEKKWKKLQAQEDAKTLRVHDAASLEKGLNYLFSLHAKRAAMKNMRSDFATRAMERFHKEVAAAFLAENILDLQLLSVRERPISAIYAFRFKKRLAVYQTGFDPEWKKFSVGGISLYLALEEVFGLGFNELDFLKGTESYKELWSNALREEFLLSVHNMSFKGLATKAMATAKTLLRPIRTRWKKSISKSV